MTSSRLIAVVWLVALFAARDAHAQHRTQPAPKRDPPKAAIRPLAGAKAKQPASTYPAGAQLRTRASPPEQPHAAPASKEGAPRPPITPLPFAVVGVEPRWEARFFRHTEFTAPDVRSYNANGYAAIALAAELYPLSSVGSTFWRGLGVNFGYMHSIGLQSDSTRLGDLAGVQSVPVDTQFSRYTAGLRYRLAVNPQSSVPLVLATSASYCGWDFDFGPELPRGPDLEIPTADYRMVRLGIDAGLSLSPFTFFTALSYLHAFSVEAPSTRELASLQYPHLVTAEGMGAEIRAAVGVVVRRVELRLSAEYAVLAFHLEPIRGRQDRAALVVDSYVSFGVGAHVRF